LKHVKTRTGVCKTTVWIFYITSGAAMITHTRLSHKHTHINKPIKRAKYASVHSTSHYKRSGNKNRRYIL